MGEPAHYQIEKELFTDKYFIKSDQYKYVFDWDTLQEIRKRLYAYPTIDLIDDFYSDLDMFTRKKIKRSLIDN